MAKSALEKLVRREAMAYPGAWEDHPWGDTVFKVGKKVFVFAGTDDRGRFGLSVKLPRSGLAALKLSHAEPTGYGLGRAGWVSLWGRLPAALVKAFIEESYRAVAPKKLVAQLEALTRSPSTPRARARRRTS